MVAARPIRVAFDAHVVGRQLTGNETYAVGLGTALARRPDIDLTVLLDRGVTWPLDGGEASDGAAAGRTTSIVQLRSRRPQVRIPIELPVRARQARADILHVQYVVPPVIGRTTRLAVAVHDLSFEDLPASFRASTRWRLRASVRTAVRRADVILALTEFTRDRILERYDPPPARVVVAPAGVDERFRPVDADGRAAARERLADLGLPRRFVLHVGDLVPRKNVPRLAEAIGRLRTVHDDLGLVLAGKPGRDAPRVLAAAKAAHGDDAATWVHALGYVGADRLLDLYAAADVVAYPSLYEGFGLPALEAMATGAVLVTSDQGAVAEVVADAALTTDVADPAALAEALDRALTDADLRCRLRVRRTGSRQDLHLGARCGRHGRRISGRPRRLASAGRCAARRPRPSDRERPRRDHDR